MFAGQKNTDWADHISVFLVGVIARIDEKNPNRSSAIPFAKVGMGYSMDELVELRARLKPHWSVFDPRF
jgi:ATP-dependent DNA ligase